MSQTSIPRDGPSEELGVISTIEDTDDELKELLANFHARMPLRKANKALGIRNGSVEAAIARHEIEPLRVPESKRMFVTPQMLAKWIRDYW